MACYGNKPPEFLSLQPNGQIPVAVIDGEVLRQDSLYQMPNLECRARAGAYHGCIGFKLLGASCIPALFFTSYWVGIKSLMA